MYNGRPAQSSWGDFDDFGGAGSFDDDLEDYLAAKAAEEAAPQRQPPPGPPPPDLDELDELNSGLADDRGRAGPRSELAGRTGTSTGATPTTGQSRLGVMATACVYRAVVTGSAAGPGTGARQVDKSQETVQQGGAQRLAKRPRMEARGRPTMEELFGSDEEEGEGAAARGEEAAAARLAHAAEGAGRKGFVAAQGAEGEEEEAAELPLRAPYFPPQRLASSIHDGKALPVTAASGERVYCRWGHGCACLQRIVPFAGWNSSRKSSYLS